MATAEPTVSEGSARRCVSETTTDGADCGRMSIRAPYGPVREHEVGDPHDRAGHRASRRRCRPPRPPRAPRCRGRGRRGAGTRRASRRCPRAGARAARRARRSPGARPGRARASRRRRGGSRARVTALWATGSWICTARPWRRSAGSGWPPGSTFAEAIGCVATGVDVHVPNAVSSRVSSSDRRKKRRHQKPGGVPLGSPPARAQALQLSACPALWEQAGAPRAGFGPKPWAAP